MAAATVPKTVPVSGDMVGLNMSLTVGMIDKETGRIFTRGEDFDLERGGVGKRRCRDWATDRAMKTRLSPLEMNSDHSPNTPFEAEMHFFSAHDNVALLYIEGSEAMYRMFLSDYRYYTLRGWFRGARAKGTWVFVERNGRYGLRLIDHIDEEG